MKRKSLAHELRFTLQPYKLRVLRVLRVQKMTNLNSLLQIPPHIISTKVDDEAVLLNTRNNQYYTLDEVGARFWALLLDGQSFAQSHAALLTEYEVDAITLEADLLELLADLRDNGLVEIAEA